MDASIQQSGRRSGVAGWLPRGDTLDATAFLERHRSLSVLLGLHLPVLIAFGIIQNQGVVHSILEVGLAGALLGLAQLDQIPDRFKGILVSAGLVWCSAVAVHFSGGMIEAHFHFFVILGFIALYQDWLAFGWAIMFTALSHGAASALTPELMFNHDAAIQRPWTWALIHAGMVLFAATGQVMAWRHAEANQHRVTDLNTQLIREQSERQASYSRIYVNLARRNQSLLHRQLAVIDELEQHEENPDTLRRLFALDHLTTRVRRNAESLLVMAGEDSPRRWSSAVSLADIARAAASEIEQYERTDVRVTDELAVTGGAVVDITHLLAELIENAAEYSSPETTVLIAGQHNERGAVITVEDYGIGMSERDLLNANEVLADPPELDEEQVRQLGFQVVGRLAGKLGLTVRLRPTVGGGGPRAGAGRRGITAVVEIPAAVLAGELPKAPEHAVAAAPAEEAPEPDPVATDEPDEPLAATPEEIAPLDPELAEVTRLGDHGDDAPAARSPAPAPPAPEPASEPVSAPSTEAEFTPPPAVRIPERPAAGAAPVEPQSAPEPVPVASTAPPAAPVPPSQRAPAGDAIPTEPEPGPPSLFLAKQPPAAGGLSRKARKARRSQPRPDPASEQRQQQLPQQPAPTSAVPTPATPPPTPAPPSSTSAPATNGGSTIDDIDQLAQYASRLPQRTPNASLAPELRQQPGPEPEAEQPANSDPEARRALSAFQSAAQSARRSTEDTLEHPS